MLLCRSCLRKYTGAINNPIQRLPLSPLSVRVLHNGAAFRAASAAAVQTTKPASSLKERSSRRQPTSKKYSRENTAREYAVQRFGDPLRLAEETLGLLKKDKREDALKLVRNYSRGIRCTVSWNHLINHDLSKGRVTDAIKTFNEMKKRGQSPDAHTFTIILRGLAKYPQYPQTVKRAQTIYHAMFAQNSPVQPSTIHLNAVINVCARARDLDAIFGITSRMPEFGAGSPDTLTYTIILNCLRENAWKDGQNLQHETDEVKMQRRQGFVDLGRRLWQDISKKWSKGMVIDESLVAAMARLLIVSDSKRDCDDVLSLVQQTMAIPRQIPPIGDPQRATHLTSSDPQASAESDKSSETKESDDETESLTRTDVDSAIETTVGFGAPSGFAPLKPSSRTIIYARPGRNILSVLVDACTRMNAGAAANEYWKRITSQIEPDLENYHMYLRHLRKNRSSKTATETLVKLSSPKEKGGLGLRAEPKTYRIALSACTRNAQDPFTLDNATTILNSMRDYCDEVDTRAVQIFTSLLQSRIRPNWPLKPMISSTSTMFDLWKKSQSKLQLVESSDLPASRERRVRVASPSQTLGDRRTDFVELSNCVKGQIDRVKNRYTKQMSQVQADRLRKMNALVTGKYVQKTTRLVEMDSKRSRKSQDEEFHDNPENDPSGKGRQSIEETSS